MEGGATTGGSGADVQSQAAVSLCKAGCGFYANSAFEGMCSKCFRDDMLSRQQQNAVELSTAASSDGESESSSCLAESKPTANKTALQTEASSTQLATCSDAGNSVAGASTDDQTHSVETGSPTIATAKSIDGLTLNSKSDVKSEELPAVKPKPKKNRCLMCKKKIGLTGFGCRCGGLYCAVHRYSDKHDCSFNYRELGQDQIRKSNPVVAGEKIKKL